jgi:hypothetical protein
MADITMLPTAGDKPWDVPLNQAISNINVQLENTIGIPAGGATGEVLLKTSGTDYDVEWADSGAAVGNVPTGGAAGQVLTKQSGTDYDADWDTPRLGYVSVNAQTGTTYTIVLADSGALVTLNNASPVTVTLPQDSSVAIPVGERVDFAGIGVGLVTFAAGTGATVNGTPSLVTRARYSAATAVKIAANTWLLVGDLA